jgi:hypothetical protein
MNSTTTLKLISVAIFAAVSACKPTQTVSDANSLDNFTAAEGTAFTFNSCSGTNAVSVSDDKLLGTGNERSAIRSALSAVPAELQAAFFETLKGRIAVVKDITSSCKVPAGVSGVDATLACWQPGTSDVTVYIRSEASEQDTVRNIRHSVVRSMGYILTDIVMKVRRTSEGTKLVRNDAFETVKSELSAALVADLKSAEGYKLPALYQSDRAAFESGAFAESFDSWYCSAESRAKMLKSFPATHNYFADVAEALPAGLSSTEVTAQSSEGFGLWGRWGAGNGPIRQGLSNWGNFRAEGGGLMNFRRFNNGGGLVFRRPWFNPFRWQ